MKFAFWDEPQDVSAITGPVVNEVLSELCDRKQSLLIATPYLQFDSRFLEIQAAELQLKATMGRDTVKHALSQHPLRLRFPWALTFYAGAIQILAYEQQENRRILKVSMPEQLVLDEQRRRFRLERVGRSGGAVSTQDGHILKVSLENLSTLGASVFCLEPIPQEKFQVGRILDVSLSLERGPTITTTARICHLLGQSLGLAFHPPLSGLALEKLETWIAPLEQEARQRWENRAELRARAEQAARPKDPPSGVLLVTGHSNVVAQITSALAEVIAVRTVIPVMGPYLETAFQPPLLLMVDAGNTNMEDRYRLRTLLEAMPVHAPLVVMGQGLDQEKGRLLASEMKAATYVNWNPEQAVFLRRLVRGLIRNYWKTESDPSGSNPPQP